MKFMFLSTTSKHDKDFMKLPDKKVFNKMNPNYLVSKVEKLRSIVDENNNGENYFVLDTEKKQDISLYDELDIPNKIDYKPNDLTMEAADLAILNYFNRDLRGRSFAVYGTGNLSFKLSLRLSERNANVYIYGRNREKVSICINALKQITFDEQYINYGDYSEKVDGLFSFVSADEVIGEKFLEILKEKSLCLDGGIGNFSRDFIKLSIKSEHDVRRLDVRQSQEIMDGYINSRINSDFDNIIGRNKILDFDVIAGGIMGREGEVILDRIIKPTKVVGIANGIGGVKDATELIKEERKKINKVQEYIQRTF